MFIVHTNTSIGIIYFKKIILMTKDLLQEYRTILEIEKNILTGSKEHLQYKRDDFFNIPWEDPCLGIFGERGVGKTTLLLQRRQEVENSLYFSADHVIIKATGLFYFVMYCVAEEWLQTFFIDEIFRYENRKQEIKNIFDSFPWIKVCFSGSSALAAYDGIVDLWRRIYEYRVHTLSFREFLKLKYHIELGKITFKDLIKHHKKLSLQYSLGFKQKHFKEYLKSGAYPFGLFQPFWTFLLRLQNTIDRVLLEDLKYMKNYETQSLIKLSKLIYFIAKTPPSELSIHQLSQKINLDKNVVDSVLFLLNKISVVNLIPKWENLSQKIRKEYKIFLGDTNKYYVNNFNPEIGTIREAFFASEVRKLETSLEKRELSLPQSWDFKVESQGTWDNYYFEIWWKSKSTKKYPDKTFIVKDDIEVSENEKTIPLRLFGFLN